MTRGSISKRALVEVNVMRACASEPPQPLRMRAALIAEAFPLMALATLGGMPCAGEDQVSSRSSDRSRNMLGNRSSNRSSSRSIVRTCASPCAAVLRSRSPCWNVWSRL